MAQEVTVSYGHGAEGFMGRRHEPGVRPFERGGIKFAIMGLLKDKPRHGYDVIRAMEEHSKGLYTPSAGAIYPILQALEDRDLLASATVGGKRVYSITEIGLAFLEQNKEEAQRHEERWLAHLGVGGDGEGLKAMIEARRILDEVMRAVRATADDPAKRKGIREVLEEAARKAEDIAKG
jgi:DNA-binding PadR family transcriptional regulator